MPTAVANDPFCVVVPVSEPGSGNISRPCVRPGPGLGPHLIHISRPLPRRPCAKREDPSPCPKTTEPVVESARVPRGTSHVNRAMPCLPIREWILAAGAARTTEMGAVNTTKLISGQMCEPGGLGAGATVGRRVIHNRRWYHPAQWRTGLTRLAATGRSRTVPPGCRQGCVAARRRRARSGRRTR